MLIKLIFQCKVQTYTGKLALHSHPTHMKIEISCEPHSFTRNK